MTAELNRVGTGLGKKVVTRPVTKKRGANAKAETRQANIASNQANHRSLACTPVAEIAAIPPEDLAPLTDKAKAFVRYWAEGDSITSAAIRAGYGDGASYAYRLVHRADVKAMYEQVRTQYQEAAQLSRVDVMNGLKDAIDMAKLMSEPATMIAGWREIGKLCGYYEPKKVDVNVSVNGSVAIERMNKMTEAQLLEIIERAAREGVEQEDLLPSPAGTGSEDDE